MLIIRVTVALTQPGGRADSPCAQSGRADSPITQSGRADSVGPSWLAI